MFFRNFALVAPFCGYRYISEVRRDMIFTDEVAWYPVENSG
jgi:hypothetical protein